MNKNAEKVMVFIGFVLFSLFATPVAGAALILEKDSNVYKKSVGIVLLIIGVILFMKKNGFSFM